MTMQDEAPKPAGGTPVERPVRPLEARAWMYHDGPTPEHVPHEFCGTRVLAWEQNPHYRNETPLYALTAEEVTAVNKLRARKEWMRRETHRCRCDHNEYCEHCWPVSFRFGGPWYGLGA